MKTNTVSLLFLFLISLSTNAQTKDPKNYLGVSGIMELNRLALSTGIEYERWLLAKGPFAIGAKAHYVFPSRTINYIFSSNDGIQRARQIQLMSTSYFFTNPVQEPRGFFFSLAGGINFIRWEGVAYDASGNRHMTAINEVSPGFDLAIGGQMYAGAVDIRVTGGYQAFPADKYSDFVSGNGISLVYLKVSLGF